MIRNEVTLSSFGFYNRQCAASSLEIVIKVGAIHYER